MTLAQNSRLLAAAAATAFFTTPLVADTDQVTITADNGKVAVSGYVVAVKDRTLTVQTDVGPLTFNIDAVSCTGAGCPTLSLDNVVTTAG